MIFLDSDDYVSDHSNKSNSQHSSDMNDISKSPDFSTIDFKYDNKLKKNIKNFDIKDNQIEDLKVIYQLNTLIKLKDKIKYSKKIFPELYRLVDKTDGVFKDDFTEEDITNFIYDKKYGIPFLLKVFLNSLDKDKELYDYEQEKWIIEKYSKDSFLKDLTKLSLEEIKKKLSTSINDNINRQLKKNQIEKYLNDIITLDNKYIEYLNKVLNIPEKEISEPWNDNSSLMTQKGKIGILPNPIREYLESIDKQDGRVIYLRYGSIPDGDCLFHSYLDLTNLEYFKLSPNKCQERKEKEKHLRELRFWLKNNCTEYDYNYLNPQLSYAKQGQRIDYKQYADHLGNITEWGYDLDIIYLMNTLEYRLKEIIQKLENKREKIKIEMSDKNSLENLEKKIQKINIQIDKLKKDYSYHSYNIFLFHFDPEHLVLPEESEKMEEYGKRFIHLLDHYQYDKNRNNIFIYNKDSVHYESIIRIHLPENLPSFNEWLQDESSINSDDHSGDLIVNKEYLNINHQQISQYNSSEEIITNLVNHIQEVGENAKSWESHSIRNWEDSINYTCSKNNGNYKKIDGFKIPDHRGVCPTDTPWRFKMGNTDNFCCIDSEEKAKEAIRNIPEENEYKDSFNREIPRINKIDANIIKKNTLKNLEKKQHKKTHKNKSHSNNDLDSLRTMLQLEGKKTKGFDYYKEKPWVKHLIDEGYIQKDGENFEKYDIYYQFCCKKLRTHSAVIDKMKEYFPKKDTSSISNISSEDSSISTSSIEISSSDSSQIGENSQNSDINNEILIKYLSGEKTIITQFQKTEIEDYIIKNFPYDHQYLINILNTGKYLGCSNLEQIIECIKKNPQVTAIEIDNNDISSIDEEISDLDYPAYCRSLIKIKNKDIIPFIDKEKIKNKKKILENIHSNVPLEDGYLQIYYGNLCNQSLYNGKNIENGLSIYMYPKNDIEDIMRVAVCEDFKIINKRNHSKVIEYKNIYFLDRENNYQELRFFLNKGEWIPKSNNSSGGSKKKTFKKKTLHRKLTRKNRLYQ